MLSQIDFKVGVNASFGLSFGSNTNNLSNISITAALFHNNDRITENEIVRKVGMQSSINLYFNGIGNSQLKSDYSLDFHNSFFFTVGQQDSLSNSLFLVKNGYDYNPSIIDFLASKSLSLASNFIVNNRGRNQVYGSLNLQYHSVRLVYFNDATPFHWLKLADGKDRWWTGGGYLEFNVNKNEHLTSNKYLRVGFNRFTWENDDAYKLSTKLGLKFIPTTKEKVNSLINNFGNWFISYQNENGRLNLELNNLLPDGQDLIHSFFNYSKHSTVSPKSVSLRYEYFQNIRF